MSDVVHDLRTFFHGDSTAVTVPLAILEHRKADIRMTAMKLGFTTAEMAELLAITLGDPADVVLDAPVGAYVNASRWIAKDECGGCEFVDWQMPVFMCCSCWNKALGYRWRSVTVPGTEVLSPTASRVVVGGVATPSPTPREAIEAALLERPDVFTRNWRPGETVADLLAETTANLVEVTSVVG